MSNGLKLVSRCRGASLTTHTVVLALALLVTLPGLAGEVVVKSGETLAEIADRYGTTVDQLMRLNGLRDANDLWTGSRIQVPGASPRPSQAAVNRNANRYTIQEGETLSEIASRYGVPMERLIVLNNLSRPDQLIEGSILRLKRDSEPQAEKIWVKVREPLTLGGLAAELGEERRVIALLNDVKTDHDFEAGDWLVLPSSSIKKAKRLLSVDSSELRRTPPLADRHKVQPEPAPLVTSLRPRLRAARLELGTPIRVAQASAGDSSAVQPLRHESERLVSMSRQERFDKSLDELEHDGVVTTSDRSLGRLPMSLEEFQRDCRTGARSARECKGGIVMPLDAHDGTNGVTKSQKLELRPKPTLLPEEQAQGAERVNKIAEAVTVRIEGATQGSGVLVKRDGNRYTVLTAWHVVSGQRPGEELDIYTADGQRHQLDEGSVKRLGMVDVAAVQFSSPKPYEVARAGDLKDIRGGTNIYVAGFPVSTSTIPVRIMRFTKGDVVANISNQIPNGYQLLYSNRTLTGMSGGAVLNSKGELVGIHASAERDDQVSEDEGKAVATGHNVAVPISYFTNYSSATTQQDSALEQDSKTSPVNPTRMSKSLLERYQQAVQAQQKLMDSLMGR